MAPKLHVAVTWVAWRRWLRDPQVVPSRKRGRVHQQTPGKRMGLEVQKQLVGSGLEPGVTSWTQTTPANTTPITWVQAHFAQSLIKV